MFDRIHLGSHFVLGFSFGGRFLITASISVLVIGLFITSKIDYHRGEKKKEKNPRESTEQVKI